MDKRFDVIGIGSCALDFLGIMPEFPKPDTKIQLLEFIQQGGGTVGTALVTLARLGATVSYLGQFGDDEPSNFLIRDFQKEGVDTSLILTKKGASVLTALVLVDKGSGKRTIFWTDKNRLLLPPKEVSPEIIEETKFLHIDEYDFPAALKGAKLAKEKGIKVIYDGEHIVPKVEEILNFIDYAIVSKEFALNFTGKRDVEEAGRKIHNKYRGVVCITMGENGSFTLNDEGSFFQKAFKVKVVDTTGCGDVFHGAFIYGLLQNWDLKRGVKFASATAALKCRALGGRAGIPNRKEVEDFLLSS